MHRIDLAHRCHLAILVSFVRRGGGYFVAHSHGLAYQPVQAQTQDPYKGIWEGKFMKEFRTALKFAISELSPFPGATLSALYESSDPKVVDVENVLIYNVGTGSFTKVCGDQLSFRRSFEQPPESRQGQPVFLPVGRLLGSNHVFEGSN